MINSRIRVAAIAAMALVASACKSSTPAMTNTPVVLATQMVGTEGGMVSGAGVQLMIPAGALSGMQEIKITANQDAAPEGVTAVSPVLTLEPEGTTFAVPVTLTLSGLSTTSGVVGLWSMFGSTTDYQDMPITVVDSSTVTIQGTHFSTALVVVPTGHSGTLHVSCCVPNNRADFGRITLAACVSDDTTRMGCNTARCHYTPLLCEAYYADDDAGVSDDASMSDDMSTSGDGGMMMLPDGGMMLPDGAMMSEDGGTMSEDGSVMTMTDGGMPGDGGTMMGDGGRPDGGTMMGDGGRPDGSTMGDGGMMMMSDGGMCTPVCSPTMMGAMNGATPDLCAPADTADSCLNTGGFCGWGCGGVFNPSPPAMCMAPGCFSVPGMMGAPIDCGSNAIHDACVAEPGCLWGCIPMNSTGDGGVGSTDGGFMGDGGFPTDGGFPGDAGAPMCFCTLTPEGSMGGAMPGECIGFMDAFSCTSDPNCAWGGSLDCGPPPADGGIPDGGIPDGGGMCTPGCFSAVDGSGQPLNPGCVMFSGSEADCSMSFACFYGCMPPPSDGGGPPPVDAGPPV